MVTRAEREQQEREEAEAARKAPQPGSPPQQSTQDRDAARKAQDEQAKKQKAYVDEMNRKIGEVVDSAANARTTDPQLMHFTVEALKNAAQQLEAALPKV